MRRCTRIFIVFQTFSIILRSGLWAGHGKVPMELESFFHSFALADTWQGALSSWSRVGFRSAAQRQATNCHPELKCISPCWYSHQLVLMSPLHDRKYIPKTLRTLGRCAPCLWTRLGTPVVILQTWILLLLPNMILVSSLKITRDKFSRTVHVNFCRKKFSSFFVDTEYYSYYLRHSTSSITIRRKPSSNSSFRHITSCSVIKSTC